MSGTNNQNSEKHFDIIAENYDWYKKKNWYYYENLKKALLRHIPNPKKRSILEIGCGTGDIIASLNPKYGVGVDISKNMIEIAKKKHNEKNLNFKIDNAENLITKEKFDIIFMVDVVEHLEDLDKVIKSLKKCMHKDSILLITTANPLWSPVLDLAEKLKMKMEEGPHNWISKKHVKKVLNSNNLKVMNSKNFLIFPVYIPLFSNIMNNFFSKIPLVEELGLIQIVMAKSRT